jgi:hypothetical protein
LLVTGVLSGLAAYNFQQLDGLKKIKDCLASSLLLVILLCFIISILNFDFLMSFFNTPLKREIINFGNIYPSSSIVSSVTRTKFFFSVFASLFLSEMFRRRYRLRIGLVAVGLLSIYAMTTVAVVFYFLFVPISFFSLYLLNSYSFLYGRILIGLTAIPALVASIGISIVFPTTSVNVLYFLSLISGITAYNIHTTPKDVSKFVLPSQLSLTILLLLIFSPWQSFILFGYLHTVPVYMYGLFTFLFGSFIFAIEYKWIKPPNLDDAISEVEKNKKESSR